jgi:nucleotide-binding universal stress UspA family protein
MLRTVMVATDFGEDAGRLVAFAGGLSALGVKRLVLAHVVESTGLEGPVIVSSVDETRGRLRDQASALEEQGLFVETRVATGDPQQELLGLANEMQVDAVVCASHGRGIVDQLFLGSVSDRIAREARVPRLVVRYDLLRNQADASAVSRRFASKLLVATDFSAASLRAFEAALELPSSAIGTMYLLHALDPSLKDEQRRRDEEGAEFELKNWAAIARERGVTALPVIGVADPKHAILAEADERRVTRR